LGFRIYSGERSRRDARGAATPSSGVSGIAVRPSGFGFRVSGFRVSDFGFRVSDFGFRVSDFGFRGSGFGGEHLAWCSASGQRAAAFVGTGWGWEFNLRKRIN
jgi:hypothetical protein